MISLLATALVKHPLGAPSVLLSKPTKKFYVPKFRHRKRNHEKQEHAGVAVVAVDHRIAGREGGTEKQGAWESAPVSHGGV